VHWPSSKESVSEPFTRQSAAWQKPGDAHSESSVHGAPSFAPPRHAASQPRTANAVLLRTGEHAVKCGYSVRVSYQADKLAVVEAMLGTEHFTTLFARKITFSPVKESLDAFLAREAADTAAARAAILAAAERTEIATVTPVTSKRKTGTSGTPAVPPVTRPQP